MLKGYEPGSFFDEMFAAPGQPRRHYERFAQLFAQLTPEEFEERCNDVDLAFLRQGVTFNGQVAAEAA